MMTDERFSIKSIKNNHYKIAENDLCMLSHEVVDYMNTSSNAIGRLSYENQRLRQKVDEQTDLLNEQDKENQLLRKEINELYKLCDESGVMYHIGDELEEVLDDD